LLSVWVLRGGVRCVIYFFGVLMRGFDVIG
jgi:hypothetical protein